MKFLIVDDHPIFLEGLNNLLRIRGFDVVGTACNGCEAVEKADALLPDVILMDIIMPVCDGVTAMRIIRQRHPDTKVVMLTMSETDENLFAAIRNGAFGYLLKNGDTETFFSFIEGLTKGEAPLSPGLAARILKEFAQTTGGKEVETPQATIRHPLTTRQMQVLTLVADGLTYKEIGAKLFLSERTIKYHMGEIIERLHMDNRRQAIDYARNQYFTPPPLATRRISDDFKKSPQPETQTCKN